MVIVMQFGQLAPHILRYFRRYGLIVEMVWRLFASQLDPNVRILLISFLNLHTLELVIALRLLISPSLILDYVICILK